MHAKSKEETRTLFVESICTRYDIKGSTNNQIGSHDSPLSGNVS